MINIACVNSCWNLKKSWLVLGNCIAIETYWWWLNKVWTYTNQLKRIYPRKLQIEESIVVSVSMWKRVMYTHSQFSKCKIYLYVCGEHITNIHVIRNFVIENWLVSKFLIKLNHNYILVSKKTKVTKLILWLYVGVFIHYFDDWV